MDDYHKLRQKADQEHKEDKDSSDLSTSLDSSDEEVEQDEDMRKIKQIFHKKGPKDFERIQLLGRGDVGRVYLVRLKGTDKLYAMKVLRKEDMIKRKKVKRVLTEREILATTKHPLIVTLYYSFQSKNRLYFIMEYCAGGEFYRMIQRQPCGCLTEEQVRFYAAEVLSALEYLHLLGFVYRDLKPENILLHESGHIRLTDFDLSKVSSAPVTVKLIKDKREGIPSGVVAEPNLVTNSFVGTEEYLAPEVIKGRGHTATVDWWTFGILIYEMLYGTTPFRGDTRDQTFRKITKSHLEFPEHKRGSVSKECKNLIKKLLHPDPKKRLGAEGGAAEIKAHPFFKGINWALILNMEPPIIPQLNDPLDTRYFRHLSDDLGKDDDDDEVDAADLADDHPFKKFERLERPEKDVESSSTTSTQQTNPMSQSTSQPSTTKSKSRTETQSKSSAHQDSTTSPQSVKEKETTTTTTTVPSSTSISPHTSQSSTQQPLKYILVPGNEFDSDIPASSLTTIDMSNNNTHTNVNLPKNPKTNAAGDEESSSDSTSEDTKLNSIHTKELKNKNSSKVITTSSSTSPIESGKDRESFSYRQQQNASVIASSNDDKRTVTTTKHKDEKKTKKRVDDEKESDDDMKRNENESNVQSEMSKIQHSQRRIHEGKEKHEKHEKDEEHETPKSQHSRRHSHEGKEKHEKNEKDEEHETPKSQRSRRHSHEGNEESSARSSRKRTHSPLSVHVPQEKSPEKPEHEKSKKDNNTEPKKHEENDKYHDRDTHKSSRKHHEHQKGDISKTTDDSHHHERKKHQTESSESSPEHSPQSHHHHHHHQHRHHSKHSHHHHHPHQDKNKSKESEESSSHQQKGKPIGKSQTLPRGRRPPSESEDFDEKLRESLRKSTEKNSSISAPSTTHSSVVSSRDSSPKRKSHRVEGKESDEDKVEKKVASPTSSSVHRGRTSTPKTRHIGIERSNTETVGSPKKTKHYSLSPSLVYASSSDRPSRLETREYSEGSDVILKGSIHNKLQIREDSSTSEPSQHSHQTRDLSRENSDNNKKPVPVIEVHASKQNQSVPSASLPNSSTSTKVSGINTSVGSDVGESTITPSSILNVSNTSPISTSTITSPSLSSNTSPLPLHRTQQSGRALLSGSDILQFEETIQILTQSKDSKPQSTRETSKTSLSPRNGITSDNTLKTDEATEIAIEKKK